MTTPSHEVLSPSAIVVGASAAHQAEAIDLVGAILVAEGVVTADYVADMHAREAIISTYLGNGIALPHGTSETQDSILRTGLAVVQFPDGVPWGDEPARLVIGLAARSEEHIATLSHLAGVLQDEELCKQLASTPDALEIHRALTAEPTSPPAAGVGEAKVRRTVRIANPAGLHARPAAEIVDQAMRYDAEVTIVAGEHQANALSITQLIALGKGVGDEVTVSAVGDDAEQALAAVVSVLLAEGDDP